MNMERKYMPNPKGPIDIGNCPSSLKVKSGDTVYTVGQSNLYQSVTSIDTCETISLPPGCYKVVVGVNGGNGGSGSSSASSTSFVMIYRFG